MSDTQQRSATGRPCATCTHVDRPAIEAALLDGDSVSSVSATCGLTRQSLRRHRGAHMTAAIRDAGIGPFAIAVRLFETADRLRDMATEAEDRNRFTDATRATLAEAKTLGLLLSLGAKGGEDFTHAKDAAALEAAVTALVRQLPDLGDQLADELDRADRPEFADMVRTYATKCRALPQHQAVSGNNRQEIA